MSSNSARPVVTLTTDFGTGSPYVAQMKGVLLTRNSDLQVVDVTHDIPPQDVRQAALVVDEVSRRFPPRTIHIVVVDPGVGTDRLIVYAKLGQQRYVAPDNGCLSLAAARTPPELLVGITNRLYFSPEVSATFHGRDIMAPVAAHLSLGLHPERLGPRLAALVQIPAVEPTVKVNLIHGQVLWIDSFGNVITNITTRHLALGPAGAPVTVGFGEHRITGIVTTYGQSTPGSLVALIGSSGRLELAVVNGNAASLLAARPDDPVHVSW
ncbi:MAG: S-adenosyl-l-methionine hydroxide adenosyltransferase family protein [Pirellulaceae bacterium]